MSAKGKSFLGDPLACSPGKFLDFNSLSPLSWVFKPFRQDYWCQYWPVPLTLDGALQLGKFFINKNISVLKNLTDFHKMVETGVDPCLLPKKVDFLYQAIIMKMQSSHTHHGKKKPGHII